MSEGWQDELVKLGACPEAVAWAEDYSTFKEALTEEEP